MDARGPALVVEENALVAAFIGEQLADLGFRPVMTISPASVDDLMAPMAGAALAVVAFGANAAAEVSIALALRARAVPLILIIGGSLASHELPPSLQRLPLLPRPFAPDELARAIRRLAERG